MSRWSGSSAWRDSRPPRIQCPSNYVQRLTLLVVLHELQQQSHRSRLSSTLLKMLPRCSHGIMVGQSVRSKWASCRAGEHDAPLLREADGSDPPARSDGDDYLR